MLSLSRSYVMTCSVFLLESPGLELAAVERILTNSYDAYDLKQAVTRVLTLDPTINMSKLNKNVSSIQELYLTVPHFHPSLNHAVRGVAEGYLCN